MILDISINVVQLISNRYTPTVSSLDFSIFFFFFFFFFDTYYDIVFFLINAQGLLATTQ